MGEETDAQNFCRKKTEGTRTRRKQQNNYTFYLERIGWEMAIVCLVQRTLLHIFTKLQVP
jgi:hypothetical protein